MKTLRGFLKYLVKGDHNDHKPHFFRSDSVIALLFLIISLFVGSLTLGTLIIKSDFPLTAAVISSTLANLANSDRMDNGLQTLSVDPILQKAAELKAADMAAKSYFAHTSPDGVSPWYWFSQAGYKFSYAGENLAVYFSDSIDVERAWMNSPGHRANILNSHFTQVGIATAKGTYQGRDTVYVVEMFGTPAKTLSLQPKTLSQGGSPHAGDALAQATGTVKGAFAEVTDPQVLSETDTFIAVQNQAAGSPQLEGDSNAASKESQSLTQTSGIALIEKFLTSPRTLLSWLYLLLGIVIGIALIFAIGIRIKEHDSVHALYAASLLVFTVGLLYAFEYYFGVLMIV